MKLATAFLATALMATTAHAQEPIRIGFITTLTTPAAAIGNDMVDAVNLAIDHVGGEIAGHPIQVIFEDDGLQPELGRQKAEKLVRQEKVDVVSGFIWSNVLMAARRTVLDSDTFLISTNAGPSDLAGKLCSPDFFSLRGQNDVVPMALGQIMNERGVEKLYVMTPNYSAGTDMAAGVENTFEGEVVGRDFTKWGEDPQLDFSAELAKVGASGADALFAFYPGRAAIFARQFEQSGLADRVKLYTVYTFDQIALPTLQEAGIDVALGSVTVDYWSPDIDTPANVKFVEDFKERYGRLPSNYAAAAYDLIPYLKAAVEQSGGDIKDRDAVREALIRADYESVRGRYSLARNHFPIDNYRSLEIAPDANGAWSMRSDGLELAGLVDPYVDQCGNDS
ncbi:ABC transporter substrate-binding protein [Paracoccus denitrificans]|jgi:branched-chain amino acid transport system substrate-binding protein|uniref:Amino acid/amide ABC transporter substrate-binding protein, HAAT family n=1 Tax=Paracoccus denitrificans (strain Pd 1222) TaxID=318586 RepID=A1AYE7_PARDP|nr:ABC transporter substrate-binding protein [Paracoccus denitrificans]ABL68291.1 amino acid/amide ABC transporter substrate-binding protein, HAAT family [Paracoccus denitrificans PD1222]MBB4627805.1 branched-chain amino acid transport system substrate-binding protein [Paracoccus denitrificans]MCU7428659.1 ABC transporter substrate-binding protein [Paracoccus denitrificans]QAR26381.1 ABC transporter substrate-binding protein [Paracoccus denitrificans]UPV95309.1 ABC transporter substrate-bindin